MLHVFSKFWVVCLTVMSSTVAWACPYCAGREESIGEVILMFSMILLPFGIAGVVYKVIKRVATREELAQRSGGSSSGESR